MKLPIYQVDAFSEAIFKGNPAAVCPLSEWLPNELMQQIAAENNLSETAFFVPEDDGFRLRWFTPCIEVELCGHATLATAHVIFEHLGYKKDMVRFQTLSGELRVEKQAGCLRMDLPVNEMPEFQPPSVLFQALDIRDAEVYKTDDIMVVLPAQEDVENMAPDFRMLKEMDARGIIVTAPGKDVDFVSRFFAPRSGINEDPVTGSAHAKLTPYWAKRLGKTELRARQLSERGGELLCVLTGDRVHLVGHTHTYLVGEITV